MPTFRYRAKEQDGKTVEGVLEALTEEEAYEQVNRLGYLPVRIEELAQAAKKQRPEENKVSTPSAPSFTFSTRIKSKEITAFGRQLSSLIRAGVPILNAIGIIADQSESAKFKDTLKRIYEDLKNGAPFSQALGQFPHLFSPLYLALVSAGETSGMLDQTLLSITDHRQKQEEILSRIKTAMIYPLLMALTGIGTIIFMLTFVMPRLMGIFSSLGGNLPLPTRILLQLSAVFRTPWIPVLLSAFGLLALSQLRKKSGSDNKKLGAFLLKIPVFGALSLKAQVARFTRTLELLIKSGIPVIRAIETTKPLVDNALLRNDLDRCLADLKQGGSFGASLRQSKNFPIFMTNLIAVGEESGRLDGALGEIATFYERETDEMIKIMTSLLEPLMILVMGLVIGFMVIAMLLPMFELNMIVR